MNMWRQWRSAPAFWFSLICPLIFILMVLIPASRAVFLDLTARYPYPLAFLKFALLATVGETIAYSITKRRFLFPTHAFFKAAVWGVIGMLIALMFPIYVTGVNEAQRSGMLPGYGSVFLRALIVSIILNFTFGIVMMAGHRISDTWIDGRFDLGGSVLSKIDWPAFIKVVVLRTIPLFWIPAHTITFLLPEGFRVVWSALLSIALGLILALTKPRQA